MTAKCLPLFVVLCFAAMFSCNTDNRRIVAEKIIREWTGKQIVFKEDVSCSISGNDTMCLADLLAKEYKILLYVDSAGCSSCRLKLSDWKQLIEESDSLFQDKLGFVFLFQPKSKKELSILVNVNEFDYPIVVDMTNSIDKKNHFPAAMEHQCFLLNRENEVIAIGNPAANIKIWKLYKKIISGGKTEVGVSLTDIETENTVFDYGRIKKGTKNMSVFKIKNTGNNPLIINRVTASCGCTHVSWDKHPIEPDNTATVTVEMTPEETGRFSKTLDVYCNATTSPVRLTVTGEVIENK